jgi:hypothetical protein
MATGVGTTFFNGKMRRLPSGKAALSTSEGPCCCGPCNPDGTVCEDVECTSQAFTMCCWKCGDTVDVTFGDIVASGVGDEAWVVDAVPYAISAIANQTITATLKEVDKDPTPSGWSVFYWFSGELHRDATHVYGAAVRVETFHRSEYGPAGIQWLVYIEVWRVTIADWDKGGPCQGLELAGVLSSSTPPVDAADGTCCGQDSEPLTNLTDYITSADPATDITPDSECESVCDCDELPSSVLVDADCINATINRGAGECVWSGSEQSGSIETCDLIETNITLRRSNSGNGEDEYFCGWVLEIFQDIYGTSGEECGTVVDVRDIKAHKAGGGPIGTYTVFSGSGCGTEIEVS